MDKSEEIKEQQLYIEKIYKILDTFLNTQYEGGRHDRRLQKIRTLEEKNDLEGE